MNTKPTIFDFNASSVRVISDDRGEPIFSAADVCAVLGYRNSRDAVAKHCKEHGVAKRDIIDELGRTQEMTFINEGNLYRLIVKSRKPEAEAFEIKVMEEILPTIRKTGRYEIPATKKALPGKLTAESQDLVKKAFRERVEERPQEKWGVASRLLWSAIGSKFGTRGTKDGYKNIPNEALSEIMSLIARTPLPGDPIEGEYMPAANDPQTLNDTIARMTQQVESGNGTPVDVFLPLVMAVVKKRPELLSEFVTEEQLTRAAIKQLQTTRFTVQFSASDYFGSEASPIMVPIAKDAQTLKPQDVINEIASNRMGFFSDGHIKEIICAIGTRLKAAA